MEKSQIPRIKLHQSKPYPKSSLSPEPKSSLPVVWDPAALSTTLSSEPPSNATLIPPTPPDHCPCRTAPNSASSPLRPLPLPLTPSNSAAFLAPPFFNGLLPLLPSYMLDEVDEKMKTFRDSASSAVADDASAIDKIQPSSHSTAVKASAGAFEFYLDIRRMIEERVRDFTEPSADKLLPDLLPEEQQVYTLVLDLGETLIHSDWKRERGWRTFKRPGLDAFLEHLSQFYEIVVYFDQKNTIGKWIAFVAVILRIFFLKHFPN